MTTDSPSTAPVASTDSTPDSPTPEVKCDIQISIKSDDNKLVLKLPTQKEFNGSWYELWSQFKHRLNGSERNWEIQSVVHLAAQDRLLDTRQLQEIADALNEVGLNLKLVKTSRRQTAVVAATAGYSVQQEDFNDSLVSVPKKTRKAASLGDPLYITNTLRSGVEVRHPGSVILVGDVNPGGSIIAAGDIIIWGCLRGIAHAGVQGDRQRRIMALEMKPTQLRIADAVARAPEQSLQNLTPEVAYVTPEGIRLAPALDFGKNYNFSPSAKAWENASKKLGKTPKK